MREFLNNLWRLGTEGIGLSYWPARLGIDYWAPQTVYKYGLWLHRFGGIDSLESILGLLKRLKNMWRFSGHGIGQKESKRGRFLPTTLHGWLV